MNRNTDVVFLTQPLDSRSHYQAQPPIGIIKGRLPTTSHLFSKKEANSLFFWIKENKKKNFSIWIEFTYHLAVACFLCNHDKAKEDEAAKLPCLLSHYPATHQHDGIALLFMLNSTSSKYMIDCTKWDIDNITYFLCLEVVSW